MVLFSSASFSLFDRTFLSFVESVLPRIQTRTYSVFYISARLRLSFLGQIRQICGFFGWFVHGSPENSLHWITPSHGVINTHNNRRNCGSNGLYVNTSIHLISVTKLSQKRCLEQYAPTFLLWLGCAGVSCAASCGCG
jgi:hypothetical protein